MKVGSKSGLPPRTRQRIIPDACILFVALGTTITQAQLILGVPKHLGSDVNTSGVDLVSSVSNDQLTLYWHSGSSSRADAGPLLVSTRESVEDTFAAPTRLDTTVFPVNPEVSISADSRSLYFANPRRTEFGGYDLYEATRETDSSAWISVSNLGSVVNSNADERWPFVTTDGLSLYFSDGTGIEWASRDQRAGGMGGADIWVSHRTSPDTPWQPPENLGPIVNGPKDDRMPNVSSDGLRLFFASLREGGNGKWNIWMSSRDDVTQAWGTPENLGPTVNGGNYGDAAHVSRDGRTLYYASDRPGGVGSMDLWQVPLLQATFVPVDVRGGVYSQDFDEALGNDATNTATELPVGWTAKVNDLVSIATLSKAFNNRRVRPNGDADVYNAGIDGEVDRSLATGVSRNGDGNELELRTLISGGSASQLRVQFDLEAWGAPTSSGSLGEAAFELLVESDKSDSLEPLIDLGTVTTGPTLELPADRLIDGNNDSFRVAYDSGWINDLDLPENTTLRFRWTTDTTAQTAGWTFGLDNVQIEAGMFGDVNRDTLIDVADLDVISRGVWDPSGNSLLDLTGDGSVDHEDVTTILDLANRRNGDANFDGEVQFADFLILSSSFGEAGKSWSEGDFDSNGEVQFPDFLILSSNFGQSLAIPAAVPEPSSRVTLALLSVVGGLLTRRRR